MRKKLDAPIQTWKALNILAHRVANEFYAKTFSRSCLDRFLIEQQIKTCWFNSEFYKKKSEGFLRTQSLVFLMKRTLLSKLHWKLLQGRQNEPEKYVSVFDEERDHFCRQDVLKTIYIFTDLKGRHWNPRSSRKQDSRLKAQFDSKWNVEEGLKYDLVDQYLKLYLPVDYRQEDAPEESVEVERLKIRDYLAQIQHKYMKFPNLKLMFFRLVRRGEFFDEDKLVCVFLVIFSILVDLLFDDGSFEISFGDLSGFLKEANNAFKKLKKKDFAAFEMFFDESISEKGEEFNESEEPPANEDQARESQPRDANPKKEAKSGDQSQEMLDFKEKLKQSLAKKGKNVPGNKVRFETHYLAGMKLLVCFLETLRKTHNSIREEIKRKITKESPQESFNDEFLGLGSMAHLFKVESLKSKINYSQTAKSIEEKYSSLKQKHGKYMKNREFKEPSPEENREMAIPGLISWQKLFPKLEKCVFTDACSRVTGRDTHEQLTQAVGNPKVLFEHVKALTRFFNDKREEKYNSHQKQLKKILNKIRPPSRTLLSKDLEKDHSRMLYLKAQNENASTPNDVRIGNLVKPSGPQNRGEMKRYIDAINKGEGGSEYEEDSKILGIFNQEDLDTHLILDKETEHFVNKLRQREVTVADVGKIDLHKVPGRELKKYEDWRLKTADLNGTWEGLLSVNKYLEKEFVEGQQVKPAVSCLARKMRNPSVRVGPGTLLKVEFGLAKMKKMGQLLTRLMDEEIIFDDLKRRFEKFYLKFRKRKAKSVVGEKEKKRRKPKSPELKQKDNLLDDICQDIGFTREFKEEYVAGDHEDFEEEPEKNEEEVVRVGDVVKLDIFLTSKLSLVQESAEKDSKRMSTFCNYFYSGDTRLLRVFQNIKVYPRLRQKKRKEMVTIINSILASPFYHDATQEVNDSNESFICGKSEEVFRKEFLESDEVMITGWTFIEDEEFMKKLNRIFSKGKAMGHKLSEDLVFYLGKPNLKGSAQEVTEELWNHWGLRPFQNFSSEQVEFLPINLQSLFVFCLKRKIGSASQNPEANVSSPDPKKTEILESLLHPENPKLSFAEQPPSEKQAKKALFTVYSEVPESETEDAYQMLYQSVKLFIETKEENTQPYPIFSSPAETFEPQNMNFQPISYLGKRSNDILGAVQEIPSGNIFKGLSKKPPVKEEGPGPEEPREGLATLDIGISMPNEQEKGEESGAAKEEQGGTDINSLLEIIQNVSSEDLKDIYDSLEDPDMKEMLLKAVKQFYPNQKNPLE